MCCPIRIPHLGCRPEDREAAVMSAYSLQQQLASAREAYEKVSGQIAGARTNSASSAADRLTRRRTELLEQIAHCLTDAYNVEAAMDGYQGCRPPRNCAIWIGCGVTESRRWRG
jgi:hypothetical protein